MRFEISKKAQAQVDTWEWIGTWGLEEITPICEVTVTLEKETHGETFSGTEKIEISGVTVDEIFNEVKRELAENTADFAFVESVKFLN